VLESGSSYSHVCALLRNTSINIILLTFLCHYIFDDNLNTNCPVTIGYTYYSVNRPLTDRETDEQTDGQLTMAQPRYAMLYLKTKIIGLLRIG